MQNLDKFIEEFSLGIVKLKEFETSDDRNNLQEHLQLFKNLLQKLKKRKHRYLSVDQDLWKQLYTNSVYFYKFQTTINDIPIKLVTKHNQIIPFYMSQKIHNNPSTLVHFDTHSDESPVKDSALLPHLYKSYLDTNDKQYLKKAGSIVWDIGAANSGILYSSGARDLIWCLPSWVPDTQTSINYFLKINKKSIDLSTTENIKHIKNLEEISQVKYKPKDAVTKTYTKIQTGKITKINLEKLYKSIKKNGNKYFLDIDLDYLVCNGKPFTNSYWKETYDLSSFYRTDTIEPNQNIPRYNGDQSTKMIRYNKILLNEVRIIDQRIHKMFKILFYLKRKGCMPELISVCDSTNLQFANCETLQLHSCNSVSNNYVPMNLALYVHTKVLDKIKKLTS